MGRMEISRSTVRQSLMPEAKPARAAAISTMAKANSNIAYGASQPQLRRAQQLEAEDGGQQRSPQAAAHSPK